MLAVAGSIATCAIVTDFLDREDLSPWSNTTIIALDYWGVDNLATVTEAALFLFKTIAGAIDALVGTAAGLAVAVPNIRVASIAAKILVERRVRQVGSRMRCTNLPGIASIVFLVVKQVTNSRCLHTRLFLQRECSAEIDHVGDRFC